MESCLRRSGISALAVFLVPIKPLNPALHGLSAGFGACFHYFSQPQCRPGQSTSMGLPQSIQKRSICRGPVLGALQMPTTRYYY